MSIRGDGILVQTSHSRCTCSLGDNAVNLGASHAFLNGLCSVNSSVQDVYLPSSLC